MQCLRTLVPGHLSSHSALSNYGLFALIVLCRLFVSLRPLVQAMRSCPASGALWCSAMPHPSEGSGNNTNNTSPTSGNGQNFFAKLPFKSNNLCGSGSGRIFALPLPHPCVACRASLFIKLPCQTSFCPFFLLVCFRRLCTLIPPLYVILVFTMCIRVLLLYGSKIAHTYFYFFIRAR